MTRFAPKRDTVRLRNATVASVQASSVTLTLDGGSVVGVPVHGLMPGVGAKVLVLEQGRSLLVLPKAAAAATEAFVLEQIALLREEMRRA